MMEQMTELEVAIMRTLVYADLFDQALITEELSCNLIGATISVEDLLKMGNEVRGTNYEVRNGVWALTRREKLFDLKADQLATCNLKLATARRWRWLFCLLPWVKLVAVSGSVAGGSPKEDDDIDLVIITANRRMWLSRFMLVGILSLFRKRRRPDDDPAKVSNKFCLNMWLTEDRLKSERQDLYLAHELAQLVPIVNRDQMLERYLGANVWMLRILPNVASCKLQVASFKTDVQGSVTLNRLDLWAEGWQRHRMAKVTKEVVENDLLMFHPKDYRNEVLQKYQKRLKELGV